MWLHNNRGFKTDSNPIVCLLIGLFRIKPSLKNIAPAVLQSSGFLSIRWPMCHEQLVIRWTVHQFTLSGMWGHGKGERPQPCILEIHEAIMRRESTLCILQSVHEVWQVLHSCQYHSSELISLNSCKVWEISSSQDFYFYLFILFVCSFWADSEQNSNKIKGNCNALF